MAAAIPGAAGASSRELAWQLVCEWTESASLRRHMLAVEAAMRAYAPRFDGDVELWGMTGLLHDLDELAGFVLAVAYVRPRRLEGMTPKSVRKKLRSPSFAAAVDRGGLLDGAAGLGVDFDEHVGVVIDALAARSAELLAD